MLACDLCLRLFCIKKLQVDWIIKQQEHDAQNDYCCQREYLGKIEKIEEGAEIFSRAILKWKCSWKKKILRWNEHRSDAHATWLDAWKHEVIQPHDKKNIYIYIIFKIHPSKRLIWNIPLTVLILLHIEKMEQIKQLQSPWTQRSCRGVLCTDQIYERMRRTSGRHKKSNDSWLKPVRRNLSRRGYTTSLVTLEYKPDHGVQAKRLVVEYRVHKNGAGCRVEKPVAL